MRFRIARTEERTRGELYVVEIDEVSVKILMTWHALDRVEFWNLNIEQVLETVLYPEEVIIGHFNRYIAHKRYGEHIIRAIYEYDLEKHHNSLFSLC